MRDVGQQRAERHQRGDLELGGQAEDLAHELLPLHVRLDALHEDDVAREQRHPGDVDPGRGPRQAPHARLVDDDVRPVHLVVVVLLGVEVGQRLGVPDLAQVGDRAGGGVAGVVPALEGGDHDGIDQDGELIEFDHRSPPSACSTTASTSPATSAGHCKGTSWMAPDHR